MMCTSFLSRTLSRKIKHVCIMPQLKMENGAMDIMRITQSRWYAARRGKRVAMLAAKREKKMAEASRAAAAPKYLPKKVKQHTGKDRKRFTDENWLQSFIIDDIYESKFCRGKPYSVTEAIALLKELHDQTMLNDPEAFVYATVELNLQLKKKNHFMEEFTGTVSFPNEFETGSTNRVVALCENADDQFKASEAGAVYAGGISLIKKLEKGEVSLDNFDYVVCHLDLLKNLNKLRGLLKKKYPSVKNRLLTTCMDASVVEFIKCTEYTANSSTLEPDFGWVDVYFGRLNMTHQELEDNLAKLLNTIEENHKPIGVANTLFITRTQLWCSKSAEKFKVPHWEYLPGYPLNGVIQPEDSLEEEVET